jgi:hypothetical protein
LFPLHHALAESVGHGLCPHEKRNPPWSCWVSAAFFAASSRTSSRPSHSRDLTDSETANQPPDELNTLGDHLLRRRLGLKLMPRQVAEQLNVTRRAFATWRTTVEARLGVHARYHLVSRLQSSASARRLGRTTIAVPNGSRGVAKGIRITDRSRSKYAGTVGAGRTGPISAFLDLAKRFLASAEAAFPLGRDLPG